MGSIQMLAGIFRGPFFPTLTAPPAPSLLNSFPLLLHPRKRVPNLEPIDREAAAIVNPRNTMAQTPRAAAR
jgi:hypothetical protein